MFDPFLKFAEYSLLMKSVIVLWVIFTAIVVISLMFAKPLKKEPEPALIPDKTTELPKTPEKQQIKPEKTTVKETLQTPQAEEPPNKLEVGKDSVVMGNVPPNTRVGDGSVVIGPTDNRGNTIINTPMAVGRGAKAGPGSIAIGANAGAGLKQDLPDENVPQK